MPQPALFLLGPLTSVVATLACCSSVGGEQAPLSAGIYTQWSHGPSNDPGFFPLAVWLQDPANAERYRQAGFNTYVALWQGPTEAQLAALKRAGMRVICEQNPVSLKHLD